VRARAQARPGGVLGPGAPERGRLQTQARPPPGNRSRAPASRRMSLRTAAIPGGCPRPLPRRGAGTTPRSACCGRGTAGRRPSAPPGQGCELTARLRPGRQCVRDNLRGCAVRPREGASEGWQVRCGISFGCGRLISRGICLGHDQTSGRGPPGAEASRPTGPGPEWGPRRFRN